MKKNIPTDPIEFDKLLMRIDQQLSSNGVRIYLRPLEALSVVSTEFGIPLPLGPFPPGIVHPAGKYWPVSERIKTWYEHQYGDRLKVHLGPGRMAFLIDNDVWVFRFPRCYGRVELIVSRTVKTKRSFKGPAIYNILDSIEKLPEGLRHSLSDSQLREIFGYFMLGFEGLRKIQTLAGDELVRSAFTDIAACVDNISSGNPTFGLAKWSSLQAAEKVLKAAMRKNGIQFSRVHELRRLVEEACNAGFNLHCEDEISKIQCSPGIRYGEEECNLKQAIEAHHAVFKLSFKVTRAYRKSS